ncbi:MAG TPA: disulfide bond formation protein DsbA, partial [Pseudomonas sp.]|nr:disulfide bond formation protein DsbA [Pseudomonas sp.]
YDDPATKAETSADFSWVENLGIAGFPTLLAEHQGQLALLTNGYQPLTVLAPFLGRWLEHNAHA